MKTGAIFGINGPVLKVVNGEFSMSEMVYAGDMRLMGEVIRLQNEYTIVQAYEDTTGLSPGEAVVGTGQPLSAQLGPGLLGKIFDGIQRPLEQLDIFMPRGQDFEPLETKKYWDLTMLVSEGDVVSAGMVIAEVQETPAIIHRVMVPHGVKGRVDKAVSDGSYTIEDRLASVEGIQIKMTQSWPIRIQRPTINRKTPHQALITGQRVIDSFFPIAKGGTAAIPGGFGTGKTITQHQLAKWSDADIIVYIGCGERGNEMTDVLEDFKKLKDPRTGHSLMDRTILIANTSNMPVAAREASIYTGITIAEYYRDMGYHVAIMADSTSRWAEALRELSGRLEEMPAEEGYPAYLASRLAAFYERAGYFETHSGREGSLTIIGAVSPQGSDFSEPVTQHTKRFVRCFWALDRSLAYERHFPAIHWLNSYSAYEVSHSAEFAAARDTLLNILYEESSLQEIVKLIGAEALPESRHIILDIARIIRQDFLQQNAYDPDDAYTAPDKQLKMMRSILKMYEERKSHAV